MDKLRLFFAVDLAGPMKDETLKLAARGEENIWRWISKDDLHLTLVFIGYLDQEKLPQVIEAGQKACQNIPTFVLKCLNIEYGPNNNNARMIWLNIEKSEILAQLKNNLEKALADRRINFNQEQREFHPHITLARLKIGSFKPNRPMEQNYIKNFSVGEIMLMASNLKRSGAEYTCIQIFSLD